MFLLSAPSFLALHSALKGTIEHQGYIDEREIFAGITSLESLQIPFVTNKCLLTTSCLFFFSIIPNYFTVPFSCFMTATSAQTY